MGVIPVLDLEPHKRLFWRCSQSWSHILSYFSGDLSPESTKEIVLVLISVLEPPKIFFRSDPGHGATYEIVMEVILVQEANLKMFWG